MKSITKHPPFTLLVVTLLLLQFTLSRKGVADEPYQDWKHSGSVYLLTTPDGADLPASASVKDFPVLVRLHRDFFDFTQAETGGDDLRFSSSTGQPLPYQIEHWDAAAGIAGVWVRVPAIQGNARQEIRLHWGKANAASESDGQAVFNAANGYLSAWHLGNEVKDEVGTLESEDRGTTPVDGMIGKARHFPGGKGIFCGDKISNYPSSDQPHTTALWFRAQQPNGTVIGWGNEGGGRGSKIRMQFRSPPHIHIDSDFSDIKAQSRLPMNEWIYVAHTYGDGPRKIYINGKQDGEATTKLDIKSPGRLWLGGWYHNYDFVGDIDEVRISRVARSADWIKLQYENQKPMQTLVGPVVQTGSEFSVSQTQLAVDEGKRATVSATAGGAQKVYWIVNRDGHETIVATDRFSFTFDAGRVVGDQSLTLQFKAICATEVKSKDIAVTVKEVIPEPVFTLAAPATWDGRQKIEVVPDISNQTAMKAAGAGQLRMAWLVDDVAVIKQVAADRLILKRSQGSGLLRVSVAIDNGGAKTIRSATIAVKERSSSDPWMPQPVAKNEQPENNQFFARDGHSIDHERRGKLVYAGTLAAAADSVFVRVFADDTLYATETSKLAADKTYSLSVGLKAGLVKYRTEFGSKTGDRETVLHTASNLVCGDAYLINGQSNAVADDVGPDDPAFTSDWIRSYGSTSGHPARARSKSWDNAVVRDRMGGKVQIGYWGMELARQLVENCKIPVCIINGAVGGTRIDQHQRNSADPTDVNTIYGRLLWRVQQAKLTHGIRAVLWHQGENDQGADGPTGGFGWETYRQNFVDLAAAWKEDYPNIQHYYVFQIWPKACAMGINGSDNRLREVQRTLPTLFSNLSVTSTLGIKPPGGCHYPIEGYAQFARLIGPLVERDHYDAEYKDSITAPDLKRAYFTSNQRDELALEFDQAVVWSDELTSQFYLDGKAKQVTSGSARENVVTLKLAGPSKATRITYLDSASWSPDNLLYGKNGIAALTFCAVEIQATN